MDESRRKAFAEDGAVVIEGYLNQKQLALCEVAVDRGIEIRAVGVTGSGVAAE